MDEQENTPKNSFDASVFYNHLRQRAVAIAQIAAQHIRTRRHELGLDGIAASVKTKSSAVDPVTVVDRESEALIRALIRDFRPGDSIIGEEEGGAQSSVEAPRQTGEPAVTWVVDPIDGTVNFLYGLPVYSVSIACRIGNEVVAGAVADVQGHRIFSAALGEGAHVLLADGRQQTLSCSAPENLAQSLVATGFSYSQTRRSEQGKIAAAMLRHCRDIRRIGSAAMDLCFVAAGAIDAYYEHGLNEWDYAAGVLIAQEAGAVVVKPEVPATSADGRGVFAVAKSVAEEFFAVLDSLAAGTKSTFEA